MVSHDLYQIKFESTLRRVIVQERHDGRPDLTFMGLEAKIRDMFQISPDDRLVITYTDQENEVVTMGDDQDLHDACVMQMINPLRLDVKVADPKTEEPVESTSQTTHTTTKKAKPPPSNRSSGQSFRDALPELTIDAVKQLINSLENPYLKVALPHEVLSEAIEGILKVAKGAVSLNMPSEPAIVSSRQEGNIIHSISDPPLGSCTVENTSRRISRIFHKGVQCNGCGITPIVGPRFKSTKREDYDLCCNCFTEIGSETDFQRINRPILGRRHNHHHFMSGAKMMRLPMGHPMGPLAPPLKPSRCSSWKQDHVACGSSCLISNTTAGGEHSNGKLDARFVTDVTIFDGTEVSGGTSFTKIWRLRNIGTLRWPQGTQLVHVGGDVLGSDKPSSLELSEEGLPCEEEIDASVDLVAPECPGRYVSHWRLRAPSGQKFGQRVWVLIQVVSKDGQSVQVHVVKDYLPEISHSMTAKVSLPVMHSISIDRTCTVKESAYEPIQLAGDTAVEDCSHVVKSELSGGGFSLIERPGEIIKDPIPLQNSAKPQDSSAMTNASYIDGGHPQTSPAQFTAMSRKQEDVLLEKLSSMGFMQRTSNLKLLHKSDNNVQGTIDGLVATPGWDHMLEDLEEMGFYDAEMNRRLLSENNGSVKLVVKELLRMQNSEVKSK